MIYLSKTLCMKINYHTPPPRVFHTGTRMLFMTISYPISRQSVIYCLGMVIHENKLPCIPPVGDIGIKVLSIKNKLPSIFQASGIDIRRLSMKIKTKRCNIYVSTLCNGSSCMCKHPQCVL